MLEVARERKRKKNPSNPPSPPPPPSRKWGRRCRRNSSEITKSAVDKSDWNGQSRDPRLRLCHPPSRAPGVQKWILETSHVIAKKKNKKKATKVNTPPSPHPLLEERRKYYYDDPRIHGATIITATIVVK